VKAMKCMLRIEIVLPLDKVANVSTRFCAS
jgi:hypothetical protein